MVRLLWGHGITEPRGGPALLADNGMPGTAGAVESEPEAPTISITSGSGYTGSVYTSTAAGQWTAGGVNIGGETGTTFAMTPAYEGAEIQCAGSNIIEMWVPTDEASTLYWWDGIDTTRRTYGVNPKIASLAGKVSGTVAAQATTANQPDGEAAAILFSGAGPDSLTLPNLAGQRWAIFIGSLNWTFLAADGVFVAVNGQGGTAGTRQPQVGYVASGTLVNVRWLHSGTQNNLAFTQASSDVKFLISSRLVGGVHRAALNGGTEQTTGSSIGVSGSAATGHIGDYRTTGPAWRLGDFLMGSGDLSDDALWKLQGWAAHRHGRQAALPVDHLYKTNPPMLQGGEPESALKVDGELVTVDDEALAA